MNYLDTQAALNFKDLYYNATYREVDKDKNSLASCHVPNPDMFYTYENVRAFCRRNFNLDINLYRTLLVCSDDKQYVN